jgi:hypothetical protein
MTTMFKKEITIDMLPDDLSSHETIKSLLMKISRIENELGINSHSENISNTNDVPMQNDTQLTPNNFNSFDNDSKKSFKLFTGKSKKMSVEDLPDNLSNHKTILELSERMTIIEKRLREVEIMKDAALANNPELAYTKFLCKVNDMLIKQYVDAKSLGNTFTLCGVRYASNPNNYATQNKIFKRANMLMSCMVIGVTANIGNIKIFSCPSTPKLTREQYYDNGFHLLFHKELKVETNFVTISKVNVPATLVGSETSDELNLETFGDINCIENSVYEDTLAELNQMLANGLTVTSKLTGKCAIIGLTASSAFSGSRTLTKTANFETIATVSASDSAETLFAFPVCVQMTHGDFYSNAFNLLYSAELSPGTQSVVIKKIITPAVLNLRKFADTYEIVSAGEIEYEEKNLYCDLLVDLNNVIASGTIDRQEFAKKRGLISIVAKENYAVTKLDEQSPLFIQHGAFLLAALPSHNSGELFVYPLYVEVSRNDFYSSGLNHLFNKEFKGGFHKAFVKKVVSPAVLVISKTDSSQYEIKEAGEITLKGSNE